MFLFYFFLEILVTTIYDLKCNFDENRTTCTKRAVSTVWLLPGYSDIPLAISLSSASSFQVNVLLKAWTVTLLHDIFLWVLQLLFSTKSLGHDFILLYKCNGIKIQLPCFQ